MYSFKISVIIPVFNTEKWLRECLDSVIHQTVPFYEIILIDDGSVDKSLEICNEYKSKYDNIKVFTQSNQGQSVARNLGLKNVTGNYIAYLDSDDYYEINAHEIMQKALENEVDILYYDRSLQMDIDVDCKIHPRPIVLGDGYVTGEEFVKKCFNDGNLVMPSTFSVYRTDFVKKNNVIFAEGLYYEDALYTIHAAYYAKKVKQIPNKLYVVRRRENSTMTGTFDKKRCHDITAIHEKMFKFIKENKMFGSDHNFVRKFVERKFYEWWWFVKQYKCENYRNEMLEWWLNYTYIYFGDLFHNIGNNWECFCDYFKRKILENKKRLNSEKLVNKIAIKYGQFQLSVDNNAQYDLIEKTFKALKHEM